VSVSVSVSVSEFEFVFVFEGGERERGACGAKLGVSSTETNVFRPSIIIDSTRFPSLGRRYNRATA